MSILDSRRNAKDSYDLEGVYPLATDRETPYRNETPHPVTLSYLQWVYNQELAHAANIVQLREYYEGEQENLLTAAQREYLEIGTDVTFRLNAMAIPVDILAERMRVIGFQVRDDSEANPQGGKDGLLWRIWEHNRMDGMQVQVHKAAARDGDTFAIVGWDADKKMPVINHEMAWDGSNGVLVRYHPDNRNKVWYAVKRWVVDNGEASGKLSYMTVYTNDAIFNYVGSVGAMDWSRLPDENGTWPLPWVAPDGKPLGCPVFHNQNNGDGSGYGRSEIQNLMGPQNALDSVVIDELAVARALGFPVPWATGLKVGDNTTVSPGTMLSTESEAARFGQLPGADITGASALVEAWMTRIPQLSRTPLNIYQITGQVSSAQSQKAGDSPLVSKIRAQAIATGNFWENVIGMCRKLYNLYAGDPVTYEENIISTEWDSFESIDVNEEQRTAAETAEIRARTFDKLIINNVPRELAATLAGYPPEVAAQMAETDNALLPQIPSE
jgi:hypothetical protein